jgi:hypothetical protein
MSAATRLRIVSLPQPRPRFAVAINAVGAQLVIERAQIFHVPDDAFNSLIAHATCFRLVQRAPDNLMTVVISSRRLPCGRSRSFRLNENNFEDLLRLAKLLEAEP